MLAVQVVLPRPGQRAQDIPCVAEIASSGSNPRARSRTHKQGTAWVRTSAGKMDLHEEQVPVSIYFIDRNNT